MFNARRGSMFDWSVWVATVLEVPVHLHISMVIFLLPFLRNWSGPIGIEAEYIVGIILSILLHEFGHALMARHFGLRGNKIMLHGFGGFAMSQGPRTREQSMRISLAGPAVTLALGVVLWALGKLLLRTGNESVSDQAWVIGSLGTVNLMLAALNMLPMLPLDGGQTLSAFISKWYSESKAQRYTAQLGLLVAVIVGVLGFSYDSGMLLMFAVIGLVGCLNLLLNTGGIRMGEFFADRRHVRELQAVKLREEAKFREFLDDANSRQRKREEQNRLRLILGDLASDEEQRDPK